VSLEHRVVTPREKSSGKRGFESQGEFDSESRGIGGGGETTGGPKLIGRVVAKKETPKFTRRLGMGKLGYCTSRGEERVFQDQKSRGERGNAGGGGGGGQKSLLLAGVPGNGCVFSSTKKARTHGGLGQSQKTIATGWGEKTAHGKQYREEGLPS